MIKNDRMRHGKYEPGEIELNFLKKDSAYRRLTFRGYV